MAVLPGLIPAFILAIAGQFLSDLLGGGVSLSRITH